MGVSLQLLVVGLYLLEHGINAGRLCTHLRKSEDGGAEYEKSFYSLSDVFRLLVTVHHQVNNRNDETVQERGC